MTVSVDFTILESISGRLQSAAEALDATGSSSPASVNAGEMTAIITSMMGLVAESAGGLAEGIALAGSEVLNTSSSYWNADDAASRSLDQPPRGR